MTLQESGTIPVKKVKPGARKLSAKAFRYYVHSSTNLKNATLIQGNTHKLDSRPSETANTIQLGLAAFLYRKRFYHSHGGTKLNHVKEKSGQLRSRKQETD